MKHRPAVHPGRSHTPEELESLDRDGVICIRGALDGDWVQRVRTALDAAAANPTWIGRHISRQKKGLYHDQFVWLKNEGVRDLWFHSPLVHIATQAMRSQRANLFYDEVFCTSPGSSMPTPWHQDAAAWPVFGEHIINVWVTVDPVTRENSALEFVRGSHRWREKYRVETAEYNANLLAADLDWCQDIEANRNKYGIIRWDMEPGDVLVFGPKIVHGAGPNPSQSRGRRAIALRFTGDDARYDPRPHTMPLFWKHGLSKGDPLFPEIAPCPPNGLDRVQAPYDVGALLTNFGQQVKTEALRAIKPHRFRRTTGQNT